MEEDELLEYHSSRAKEELDRGLTADGVAAARSHLQLSSLHMQRMRQLAGSGARQDKPVLLM